MLYTRVAEAGELADTVRAIEEPSWHNFRLAVESIGDSSLRMQFVRETGDAVEYLVPDAWVLLSAQFAAHYCLATLPEPIDSAARVGVGFSPRHVPVRGDIAGVIWFSKAGNLETIEYSYLALGQALDSLALGGDVRFVALREGVWIPQRWRVRVAEVEWTERRFAGGEAPDGAAISIRRKVERGGWVRRIVRDDGDTLVVPGDTLRLMDAGELKARSFHWSVELTSLDVLGRWRWNGATTTIPNVRAGELRFLVESDIARALALPSDTISVLALPDERGLEGRVRLPRDERVRDQLCAVPGGASATQQEVALMGAWGGHAGAGVSQVPQVQRRNGTEGAAQVGRSAVRVRWLDRRTPVWVACGLAQGEVVSVVAPDSGTTWNRRTVQLPSEVSEAFMPNVDALLALRLPSRMVARETDQAVARVEVVGERDGTAIEDADVRLDGEPLRWSASERVYLSGQRTGVLQRLTVRRIGFRPHAGSLTVGVGGGFTRVVLRPINTILPEIVVGGRRMRLDERYMPVLLRAQSSWGEIFTRDDFRTAHDVHTLLESIPGVRVQVDRIRFARCQDQLPGTVTPAKVQVYLDGVRLTASGDVPDVEAIRTVSPAAIEVVEVYRGVSRIPGEFLNDACAVIALWTRPP